MTIEIPGLTGHDLDADGGRLHYRLGGDPDGPPVVLQHGWAGTGYTWRRVAPLLVEAGCSVLVPDLRGYGDSAKPAGVDGYDGRSLAEDMRAVVRHSGFGGGRPLVVVGHDMGAPGALLWAAEHPEELRALLYVEEPVLLPDLLRELIVYDEPAAATGALWWWLFALAPGAAQRIVVGNERAYLEWFYSRVPGTAEAVADGVEEYLRTFRGHEGVLGALGIYRAVPVTARQTERLRTDPVTVPVVGVGGSLSRGEAVAGWLQEVAEQVTPAVVDGGHFLPEERPEEIAELVLAQVGGR